MSTGAPADGNLGNVQLKSSYANARVRVCVSDVLGRDFPLDAHQLLCHTLREREGKNDGCLMINGCARIWLLLLFSSSVRTDAGRAEQIRHITGALPPSSLLSCG